jgi:hypothetical protein
MADNVAHDARDGGVIQEGLKLLVGSRAAVDSQHRTDGGAHVVVLIIVWIRDRDHQRACRLGLLHSRLSVSLGLRLRHNHEILLLLAAAVA